jgi:spermidine synthase
MLVKEYNKESGTQFGIECEELLYKAKSKFQNIKVYKSKKYGNILMLDDCFMLTEKGNDQYHNKCISLISKKSKSIDVLIIGGGDFGLVRGLFEKLNINRINLVEIDNQVVNISREFFPSFFKLNKKSKNKVNILIEDGYEWIKNNNALRFDVIIIDCTDPNLIAKKLYSEKFYKNIFSNLKRDGQLIQQSGSPYLNEKKIIIPTKKKLDKIGFKDISLHEFSMPIYPLGLWSFIQCKKAQ